MKPQLGISRNNFPTVGRRIEENAGVGAQLLHLAREF